MSNRRSRKQHNGGHRRRRSAGPVPAGPPDTALPPALRRLMPDGVPPDQAARTAMVCGQVALSQKRMRQAERWLAISARFVSLGRGFDALDRLNEREALQAEALEAFADLWALQEAAPAGPAGARDA
ncbi:hypothetical protein [Maricaulis sp.]|uniref:hypothetical protein n=1 Tax=Maricaulis sp. TaxID=1486257 RepID=UPI0026037533|nr:hypothetical protein [Maricaulis sp.]